MDESQNQINDLELKEPKNSQAEQGKKIQKNEDSINSLWDFFKRSKIHLIGVPEEKGKRKKLDIYLKE